MVSVLITGGAGVLGSSLAEMLVSKGFRVTCLDYVRAEEAWRLYSIMDRVRYVWKSSLDITRNELRDVDIVIDCGISVADRPLGTLSPLHTTINNIVPPLKLLETVKHLKKRPIVIYPSSFNSLYGHVNKTLNESTAPSPTSIYGWTKACVELLYMTYYRTFNVPTIVVRTGSTFGPKGRSDELPHKLILYCIKGRNYFYLRSPGAKRLWTFIEDVLAFYDVLLNKICSGENFAGMILHVAGNKGDRIITNMELAKMIIEITGAKIKIIEGEYEPGEIIEGSPVNFKIDPSFTRSLLNWQPKYTLNEALKITVEWFKKNTNRYSM